MKPRLLVLLLVPIWVLPALVIADEAPWAQHLDAGEAAYQRGDNEEAVGQSKAALKEAQDFAEQDPRFATTLNNLAGFYQARRRYDDAEPMLNEPNLPPVDQRLDNLAELYRAQGRDEDAGRLLREHGQ